MQNCEEVHTVDSYQESWLQPIIWQETHCGGMWSYNSVVEWYNQGPSSLCFVLLFSSAYGLLTSGSAIHDSKMAASSQTAYSCTTATKGRKNRFVLVSFIFLFFSFKSGWKPFPEVLQPIHWPGMTQKLLPNHRGGRKTFYCTFSPYSGNGFQPAKNQTWERKRRYGLSVRE